MVGAIVALLAALVVDGVAVVPRESAAAAVVAAAVVVTAVVVTAAGPPSSGPQAAATQVRAAVTARRARLRQVLRVMVVFLSVGAMTTSRVR